jgi:hypothetical protein
MRSLVRLAAVALVLAAACVDDDPAEPASETSLAETTPISKVAVTWETPSCDGSATGLVDTPSTTTCAGPWEFHGWNRCQVQCGTFCMQRQTCRRWMHGSDAGAAEVTTTNPTVTCTWRCSGRFCGGDCANDDPCGEDQRAADERALENTLIGQIDREISDLGIEVEDGERGEMHDRARSQTRITIARTEFGPSVPPGWDREQDGDTYTRRFECRKTIVRAKAKSADNSQYCPCAVERPLMCPFRCGSHTRRYTAPGATKPTTSSTVEVDTTRAITCMTCDDKAPVNDKFTCLTAKLAQTLVPAELEGSGVTAATFRNSIVARFKLLYERYGRDTGTKLSQTQVDQIRPLYDSEPGKAACHVPYATLTPTCTQNGRNSGITRRLQFCTNLLTYEPAKQDVRTAELDYCLGTFSLIPTAASGCRAIFLEKTVTMARDLVNTELRNSGSYGIRTVNNQLQGLPEAFKALDMWWTNARLAGQGDAWVRAEMNALVGGFWRHVHEASSLPVESSARATAGAPPSGDEARDNQALQTALDGLSERGLATDLAVLNKMTTSDIDSPPMLLIAGTAIRPLVERAETLSEMHDLVCRFRPCASSSATRIGDLWRILSTLHSRTGLSSAVEAAQRLRAARPDVWAVFDNLRIEANYTKLATAYASAIADEHGNLGYTIGHLAYTAGVQPGAASTLVQLTDLARARWLNFEKTGQFLGEGARALHAGIQNKTKITDQLGEYVEGLEAEYDDFIEGRRGLVLELLNEIAAGTNAGALDARARRILTDIDDARTRLDALNAAEGEAATALADFPKRFEDLRKQGQFGNDLNAQTETLGALTLSAVNAREATQQGNALDFAATQPREPRQGSPEDVWTRSVQAGQMVHVGVTGTWAPTCGLRNSSIKNPYNGNSYGISIERASTGPEGYQVSFNEGSFKANSFEWDAGFREWANTETCIKFGGDAIWFKIFGVEAKSWVQACAGAEFSSSQRWAGSNGEDQRTNASFSGGIRLGNTPYPDAPAGALLLVAVRPGATKPFDVQVVTKQTSWLATETADIYFVVNDLASCADDSTEALTVTVHKTTPMGDLARTLGTAMAKALENLETSAPAIIAQGQLFLNQDAALKAAARQYVRQAPYNIDVTQLPTLVRDFFEMHLAQRLASIERRAAIARAEQSIAQAELEREAMEYEIHGAQSSYPLTQLLTRWRLRELERNVLYLRERQLISFLRNYVVPALELRFPRTLEDLLVSSDDAKSIDDQLDLLEDLDFGAANDEIATHLLTLGQKTLANIVDAAIGDDIDPDLPLVGVSFPNPECYKLADTPFPAHCECDDEFSGCPDEIKEPPATTFPAVPYDVAVAAWKGLREGIDGTFEIRPEDIYDRVGGTKLVCEQSAPIIRRMAVMFVSRSQQSPIRAELNLPLRPAKEAWFPTALGKLKYTLDVGWVNPVIPGLGTVEFGEAATFHASRRVVGAGLSPFGKFRIGLGAVRDRQPPDDLREMVVLFQVDYRPIAPPGVDLAPVCTR